LHKHLLAGAVEHEGHNHEDGTSSKPNHHAQLEEVGRAIVCENEVEFVCENEVEFGLYPDIVADTDDGHPDDDEHPNEQLEDALGHARSHDDKNSNNDEEGGRDVASVASVCGKVEFDLYIGADTYESDTDDVQRQVEHLEDALGKALVVLVHLGITFTGAFILLKCYTQAV